MQKECSMVSYQYDLAKLASHARHYKFITWNVKLGKVVGRILGTILDPAYIDAAVVTLFRTRRGSIILVVVPTCAPSVGTFSTSQCDASSTHSSTKNGTTKTTQILSEPTDRNNTLGAKTLFNGLCHGVSYLAKNGRQGRQPLSISF